MASVGSSHSALTSGEDHEEASLLGCPPIGLLDEEEFKTMPPRNQARDRALYPRPKTPRLYGPLGKGGKIRRSELRAELSYSSNLRRSLLSIRGDRDFWFRKIVFIELGIHNDLINSDFFWRNRETPHPMRRLGRL